MTSSSKKEVTFAEGHQELILHHEELPPPALPPKTKIMNRASPVDAELAAVDSGSADYIPVKEKIRMIAAQQEEIVKREEMLKKRGTFAVAPPTGGVRILPPSPTTVQNVEDTEEVDNTVRHAAVAADVKAGFFCPHFCLTPNLEVAENLSF